MRKNELKKMILEQLRKIPIVQIAAEKVGLPRATFYRWKIGDKEFAEAVEKAITEGEALITDMSEAQLIGLIREKNFPAIQLWLKTHHPKYSSKVEITGNLNVKEEPLSDEQQELVQKALRLAGLTDLKQNEDGNTPTEITGGNQSENNETALGRSEDHGSGQ